VLKIRMIFQRSLELAIKWDTPGITKNPVKGIPHRPLNNARERFLNEKEAERLRNAVAQSSNTQLKFIIGLLLLTGARVSELLQAQWQHVDVERRLWFIPTSKTGRSRYVPLSNAALDIIQALPRFEKCPYLLPNPKTKKPYTSIKRAWATTIKDAKLPGLRIHDLRHSAASFMINSGVDLYAVGRVLGHADHRSTMRYGHVSNETLLAAVEAGAAKQNVAWA
jgi:integrase